MLFSTKTEMLASKRSLHLNKDVYFFSYIYNVDKTHLKRVEIPVMSFKVTFNIGREVTQSKQAQTQCIRMILKYHKSILRGLICVLCLSTAH